MNLKDNINNLKSKKGLTDSPSILLWSAQNAHIWIRAF